MTINFHFSCLLPCFLPTHIFYISTFTFLLYVVRRPPTLQSRDNSFTGHVITTHLIVIVFCLASLLSPVSSLSHLSFFILLPIRAALPPVSLPRSHAPAFHPLLTPASWAPHCQRCRQRTLLLVPPSPLPFPRLPTCPPAKTPVVACLFLLPHQTLSYLISFRLPIFYSPLLFSYRTLFPHIILFFTHYVQCRTLHWLAHVFLCTPLLIILLAFASFTFQVNPRIHCTRSPILHSHSNLSLIHSQQTATYTLRTENRTQRTVRSHSSIHYLPPSSSSDRRHLRHRTLHAKNYWVCPAPNIALPHPSISNTSPIYHANHQIQPFITRPILSADH